MSDTQVLSFDSSKQLSFTESSCPNTSEQRTTKYKASEFGQCLEQKELPLLIEPRLAGHRVMWTAKLEQLDFAHFLSICLSGIVEELEPYASFAFDATMGLLETGIRDTRVLKALPQVIRQVKRALATREKVVVHRVLLILQQLAVCKGVGSALTEYFRSFLPLCNILQDKHLGTGDSVTRELLMEALETIEAYGKNDAHLMILQYVPSFQSCCYFRIFY